MRLKRREIYISMISGGFLLILYFNLLVPGNIEKISAKILPDEGCPRDVVHKVYGKPESSFRAVSNEFLPYILSYEDYNLKSVDSKNQVVTRVCYSNNKVIGTSIYVGDFSYSNPDSELNWYQKKRQQVRRSKLYEAAVSVNYSNLEDKVNLLHSKKYVKPVPFSEVELAEFNRYPVRGIPVKMFQIYLERNGKLFVENLEINQSELKAALIVFRQRVGTSGSVLLYPDRNLQFDTKIIRTVMDLGLNMKVFGHHAEKNVLSYCSLYEFEGPPPPEDIIENENVAGDQNWKVDKSKCYFKNKEYSLEEARHLLKESSDEAPFKIIIDVIQGTTWQQVMNFYEILPENILKVFK